MPFCGKKIITCYSYYGIPKNNIGIAFTNKLQCVIANLTFLLIWHCFSWFLSLVGGQWRLSNNAEIVCGPAARLACFYNMPEGGGGSFINHALIILVHSSTSIPAWNINNGPVMCCSIGTCGQAASAAAAAGRCRGGTRTPSSRSAAASAWSSSIAGPS